MKIESKTSRSPIDATQLKTLPTVVASSVIRSSHQGDSHGGVYLINLATSHVKQVIDWNEPSINWAGRGQDRGLRGIAMQGERIYIAASDEIFVYDRNFHQLDSFSNYYLRHCHEIFATNEQGGMLYLTSTGFDSILTYHLPSQQFVQGVCLRYGGTDPILRCLNETRGRTGGRMLARFRSGTLPRVRPFDPNVAGGPTPGDSLHINNVHVADSTMYIAGTNMRFLFAMKDRQLSRCAPLPFGTHNAQPWKTGVLYNDTVGNQVRFNPIGMQQKRDDIAWALAIKNYDPTKLQNTDLPHDHARQGFGRGLCLLSPDLIAGGSSPATISVYDVRNAKIVKTVNWTMDVRNSIHGLEVWPND